MDKVAIVKEIYRDLHGKDFESAKESLLKKGWRWNGKIFTRQNNMGFIAIIRMTKENVEIVLTFNDDGLNDVAIEE